MGKATIVVNRRLSINDRYTIVENVLQTHSSKYKDGFKAAFVLLDTELSKPRLLIDNTDSPHEFHMHTALPENKDEKIFLGTYDYREALKIFYDEIKRIIHDN